MNIGGPDWIRTSGPQFRKLEVHRFDAKGTEHFVSVEMRKNVDVNEITVLGSGQDQFYIELKRIEEKHEWTTRLPKHAVRAAIESGAGIDVGGHISQAIAGRHRFGLYYSVEPIERGKAAARRHFNGIDLDEIGAIGPCIIGGFGMAG